jgi:S1-C subfamily serine protease
MRLLRTSAASALLTLLLWGAAAAQDDAAILRALEERIHGAVDKAAVVTVSIKVDRASEASPGSTPRRPRPVFPGFDGANFSIRPKDPVSGMILEADGWIATSYFNVSGELKGIEVTLPSGKVHKAEVVGYSADADIALLKIEAEGLPTLPAADPAALKTGEVVIAVGRAPDGRSLTVNPGIISAPGRHLGMTVQIDCRLNYGNVGGPLIDLEGRCVGMTCKINTRTADNIGQNSGVSFALLRSKIAEMAPRLKKGEKTAGTGKAFLGIQSSPDDTPGVEGVVVGGVVESGSAGKAGIQVGDVIKSIDGVKVKSFMDLRDQILKKKIGDTVKVKLVRGETEMEIEVPLSERPAD